jgi:hypothetical protein
MMGAKQMEKYAAWGNQNLVRRILDTTASLKLPALCPLRHWDCRFKRYLKLVPSDG